VKGAVEAQLANIERAALACMAKVSFSPTQLIILLGLMLMVGIVIGILGTLLYRRK
jgi:hypothetical protein